VCLHSGDKEEKVVGRERAPITSSNLQLMQEWVRVVWRWRCVLVVQRCIRERHLGVYV
jgi:hypothetical protein